MDGCWSDIKQYEDGKLLCFDRFHLEYFAEIKMKNGDDLWHDWMKTCTNYKVEAIKLEANRRLHKRRKFIKI